MESLWAVTPHERYERRAIVEAIVATAVWFGLSEIRRDYWLAATIQLICSSRRILPARLDPKGFWRYQKSSCPELRLAVLCSDCIRGI